MICVVICYLYLDDIDNNNKFDIIFMIYFVEEIKQGWYLVSQIFGDVFQILKFFYLYFRDVYIRLDNVGCYYVLLMLFYLWKFCDELLLFIKEYNFSEV